MKRTAGFAVCGSFCTIDRVLTVMERMTREGWQIIPIVSQEVYTQDTRFGAAQDIVQHITEI